MYLDPAAFPSLLSSLTLRAYPVPVARAVVDSVLNAHGLSFVVIDATGLGAGLASFLSRIYPPSECLVVSFTFTSRSKSDLGWPFLSIIETGRFQDHIPSSQADQGYLEF